jgi:hypothetical protein
MHRHGLGSKSRLIRYRHAQKVMMEEAVSFQLPR